MALRDGAVSGFLVVSLSLLGVFAIFEIYALLVSGDYSQAPLSPVSLRAHPLPRWERRWLREHRPPPDET